MRDYHTWLLDLDDTLQVGPLSWATVHIFPEIIAQTGIKPERATFEAAYARAQEIYNAGGSNEVLGDEFFQILGWPVALKTAIIERFTKEYQPALFEDTPAFLDWAAGRGDRLYITANNKWARSVCQLLGISHYFAEILTPADSGVSGKPSPAMWEYLKARTGLTEDADVVLVGNNLTTDGAFARNCGLDCIIVDRYQRFADMPEHCFHVTSLSDIPAQIDPSAS
jgi:FMN phosphatase YigB (HAD superfamily)